MGAGPVIACVVCKRRGGAAAIALGADCVCETCQSKVASWVRASTAEQRKSVWQLRRAESAPFERLSRLPEVTMELTELAEAPGIVEGLPPADTLRMIEVWLKLGWVDEAITSAARIAVHPEADAKIRAKAFEQLFDPRYQAEGGVEALRRALYPA